ncbi:hypothetical protein HPB50_028615 [Hyalomma asiaticum]|nr:hypothetical protein HPB50_028615 [Hyalomma asiaticum]
MMHLRFSYVLLGPETLSDDSGRQVSRKRENLATSSGHVRMHDATVYIQILYALERQPPSEVAWWLAQHLQILTFDSASLTRRPGKVPSSALPPQFLSCRPKVMTPVSTASPIQGHSGVIKRRPHQFLQAQCVVAEAAAGSTTAAVISGSRYASSFLFLTHSNELLHYAPSFCNWTTCHLPAEHDLELKVRQPDARPAPLRKRICLQPGSSVAVQALQTRRVCNVRSPATTELTQSQRCRMGVEPTACVPMAPVQLVRRQHVRHHAGSTGRRPTTFVATFGLLKCSLDACFDDRCQPFDRFLVREALCLCTIEVATHCVLLFNARRDRARQVLRRAVRQHERATSFGSSFSA